MNNPAFSDFVRRQVDEQQRPGPDWTEVKRSWLSRLDDLYARLETYLADYTASGEIVLERNFISIHEEKLGEYNAQALVIRIGGQQVVLRPIGTVLIGSPGRVDMEGRRGVTRLALVPEEADRPRVQVTVRSERERATERQEPASEPDWVWKLIVSGPPMRYIVLDAETFQTALMNVAGG